METGAISAFGAGTYNSELGEFISDDHQRLAEIIHDYNPLLSLVYIPQKDRTAADTKPWAIREDRPGVHEPVIIRYMTDLEMRDPEAVLAWIIEGDAIRNRPQDVLARIEAKENAKRLMQLKREQDDLDDRIDQIAFFASGGRDHKNYIRHHGTTLRR